MRSLLAMLVAMLALAPCLADDHVINVLYEERPPYQIRTGDGVEGLVASPAAAAFTKAGIPFQWQASSIIRQTSMLRAGEVGDCVIGLYKNRERMSFAKFTLPIYRNSPTVGLTRADFPLAQASTLSEALATPGLRLLVRAKYSYGMYIDDLIEQKKVLKVESNQPNVQLVEMLKASRADLMLASKEEATFLMSQPGNAKELSLQPFTDLAHGVERYIVCSRKVPDEIIERLNKAIGAR